MLENTITCFIPYLNIDETLTLYNNLISEKLIKKVYIMLPEDCEFKTIDNVNYFIIDTINSTNTINKISEITDTEYLLFINKTNQITFLKDSLNRLVQCGNSKDIGLIYSDYIDTNNNQTIHKPLADYQLGSVRDDFDFGSIMFFKTKAYKESCTKINQNYKGAAIYFLRLLLSINYKIIRIPEYLYKICEIDLRKSGEKNFDYVNPQNREIQIEMEDAFSIYLKEINAYIKPFEKKINYNQEFQIEATVIIPVKNRVSTIEDAIKSVLSQKTNYKFNLIIIDNHSNDGTSEIIMDYVKNDNRIIHIIPNNKDLGIGGCWNLGIEHQHCGRFAIQLDSDDLYKDNSTIQKIVDKFYDEKCAMVIGSYEMTDFELNSIPPGIIDHKEWTDENGRNNALRINGLGAPRAFYTPIIRRIKFPNVSYGEDYAVVIKYREIIPLVEFTILSIYVEDGIKTLMPI